MEEALVSLLGTKSNSNTGMWYTNIITDGDGCILIDLE